MGKVTDPALLAQLDGSSPRKVTDPAVIAQLEAAPEPGLGERIKDFALGLLPPTSGPVGALVDAASGGAYGKVAHQHGGLYQGDSAAPERLPGESDRDYASRAAHASLTDPAQQSRAFAAAGLVAGNAPKTVAPTGPGPTTVAALGPVSRIPQPIRDYLQEKSINQGRRVLTGGADPLSVKQPISPEAVQTAFDVGAIAPGRTTQHAAKVLKGARSAGAQEVASILDQLEAAGVKGPDALALARTLRQKAADVEANSVGTGAPELYRKIADELESKLSPHSPQGPAAPNLELNAAEAIKRSLQEKAKYDRVQGDKIIEGARKDIASTVRQSVEDSIANQSAVAPDLAARFVPAKENLGNIIEASNAANKGAAQAARRNAFSLRDMIAGSGASAAGAASLGPVGALAGPVVAGMSHLARTRGTPTAAWLLNTAAKAGGKPVPSGASSTGPLAGSLGGAGSFALRPVTAAADTRTGTEERPSAAQPPTRIGSIGRVMGALDSDPSALGVYGPVLQHARQQGGDDAVAARHFVLWQTDPDYRAAVNGGEP